MGLPAVGAGATLALGAAVLALGALTILLVARRVRQSRAIAAGEVAAPPAPLAEDELRALLAPRETPSVTVDGSLRVAGEAAFPVPLLVRGSVQVDEGARLDAVLEVFGDVQVGARAQVARPLVVHGDLSLGREARVPTCLVDGDVRMAPEAACSGALKCRVLTLEEDSADSYATLVHHGRLET